MLVYLCGSQSWDLHRLHLGLFFDQKVKTIFILILWCYLPFSSPCWHSHLVVQKQCCVKLLALAWIKTVGPSWFCYCILYHHGLTGKNSLISLKSVLNEAEFLILLNLDSCAHLFFLCDKMGSKCKIFLPHSEIMMVVSRKSTCESFELAAFFMEHHLSLKEQLAHCGYSNLSTWQTLSQIEWNASIYLLPMIKFMLLNEN